MGSYSSTGICYMQEYESLEAYSRLALEYTKAEPVLSLAGARDLLNGISGNRREVKANQKKRCTSRCCLLRCRSDSWSCWYTVSNLIKSANTQYYRIISFINRSSSNIIKSWVVLNRYPKKVVTQYRIQSIRNSNRSDYM